MSIEEIVRVWKSDENALDTHTPENPVGMELTEQQLQEVVGGLRCVVTCDEDWTCSIGCWILGNTGAL